MQEVSSNTFTPPHPLKTVVLLLIFNRPDTAKQVFETIRKAKPLILYVAADGSRADKPGEAEKVEQARRIATQVDWIASLKHFSEIKTLGIAWEIGGTYAANRDNRRSVTDSEIQYSLKRETVERKGIKLSKASQRL